MGHPWYPYLKTPGNITEEGTGEERCEMLSSEQDVDAGLTAAWLHAQNLSKVKPIKPVNI